jgi:hypothetical protein
MTAEMMSTLRGATEPTYPPATRGTVVVWGLLGSFPFGGMTWQVLHHVVGLRRLGYDVWYVEDSDRYAYNVTDFAKTRESQGNAEYVARWMTAIGLQDRWVFRIPHGAGACLGALDLDGLIALYGRSEAVVNVCGAQEPLPYHAEASRRIYVQTDPVSDQVAVASGDSARIDELSSYTHLFTYGTNSGAPDCEIPAGPFDWIPTVPPVCVDLWEVDESPPTPLTLTTVAKWRHADKDVNWRGARWRWSKHAGFHQFIGVPERSSLALEMAVSSITDAEREELEARGWVTRTTASLADPMAYRQYIQSSAGEFTVAKEQYVAPRSGWFSDRSVCYLASGRPVIMQDTAFSQHIPTGLGLIGYTDADEAVAAIDSVAIDYDRHAEAARELARDVFDAQAVLGEMMRIAGL